MSYVDLKKLCELISADKGGVIGEVCRIDPQASATEEERAFFLRLLDAGDSVACSIAAKLHADLGSHNLEWILDAGLFRDGAGDLYAYEESTSYAVADLHFALLELEDEDLKTVQRLINGGEEESEEKIEVETVIREAVLPVEVVKRGRRFYVTGLRVFNDYEAGNSRWMEKMGFTWDAEVREWWTGKKDLAEQRAARVKEKRQAEGVVETHPAGVVE